MIDNLRYAARMLRKSPGVTAASVLTIALGIGANTAVFSIMNAMYFRPPSAHEPNRLVWVNGHSKNDYRLLSYPEYREYRDSMQSLSGLAVYQDIRIALGGAEPLRMSALVVSGNYFDVLGLRMAAGRAFLHDEDSVADPKAVTVIGWSLWQRLFNGDMAAIGQSVIINGQPFTVIGVAPEGFIDITEDRDVPGGETLWVPIATFAQLIPPTVDPLSNRTSFWLRAFGRLAPGTTAEAADAEVRVIANHFAQATPNLPDGFSAGAVELRGLQHPSRRDDGATIVLFLFTVPFIILLIACANVANLLLGRASTRRREIAVRLALGASRWRLVTLLLTESMLLAAAGGVAGLLVSLWITDLIFVQMGPNPELRAAIQIDWRVAGFAVSIALVTGILCGLAPARDASRCDLVTSLKDDAAGGRSRGRSRLSRAFVVAQVVASMVLLVATGLFLRSLAKLARVDTGFEIRNAVTASFDLSLLKYDAPRIDNFQRELLERVRALPDVSAASLTSNLPFVGPDNTVEVLPAEQSTEPGAPRLTTGISFVSPDYFRTIEATLLSGRDFTDADNQSSQRVVIVNETLARRLWPDGAPLGRRLSVPFFARRGEQPPAFEVIGLVRDHRYRHLEEQQYPVVYLAQRQHPGFDRGAGARMTIVARTSGSESATIMAVRETVRDLDPNLPLFNVHTLRELVTLELSERRSASTLLIAFAALAVFLTALGLYGVMSFAVAQRRREIAVRIALGAQPRAVVGLVVRDALRLTAKGLAIGLLLSAGFALIIRRFLYGVTPTDAGTFTAVALLLTAVALLATWIPARRAAAIDPMVVLRAE